MKKLFAGLVASIMMTGLVSGLTGSPASAEVYPNSRPTGVKLSIPDSVQKGDTIRIGVKVEGAGNADPKNGNVTLRIVRDGGDYRYVEVKDYDGGWVYFRSTKLPHIGKYSVHARYDRPGPNSPWQDSNQSGNFRVTR